MMRFSREPLPRVASSSRSPISYTAGRLSSRTVSSKWPSTNTQVINTAVFQHLILVKSHFVSGFSRSRWIPFFCWISSVDFHFLLFQTLSLSLKLLGHTGHTVWNDSNNQRFSLKGRFCGAFQTFLENFLVRSFSVKSFQWTVIWLQCVALSEFYCQNPVLFWIWTLTMFTIWSRSLNSFKA